MRCWIICLTLTLFGGPLALPALAADLSATESQWLRSAAPVLAYARGQGLPMDIIVQPQAAAGLAPLAMAFVAGRCKLVLSMRGNPEAQATLDRIPAPLRDAAVELMVAHELGHCRRYLDGAWASVPAGFVPKLPAGLSDEYREAYGAMFAARREEGYGDLVGLAWTRMRHPGQYAALYAWLVSLRTQDLIPGSHHDTLAWLQLAPDGAALAAAELFAGSAALWARGLLRAN